MRLPGCLDVDVLRRIEGEVELETARGVAAPRRGSRHGSRRRLRGSRGHGRGVGNRIVIITTAALKLEDERPEERRQGEGLQQLHRFEKARAEEVRTRAEALHSSFCHRVPPR